MAVACSFNDKKLIQYRSWKKKGFHQDNNTPQIEKQGVLTLGKQPCGDIWVLSQECFFHKSGVVSTDHKYRWLNKLVTFGNTQREMSLEQITCKVSLPLSLDNFSALVQQLERCLEHNFISGMYWGSRDDVPAYSTLQFLPSIGSPLLLHQQEKPTSWTVTFRG